MRYKETVTKAGRDYVAEIEAKRQRLGHGAPPGAERVSTLSEAYKRSHTDRELRRYFPVALIATVEASVRFGLGRLIDRAPAAFESFVQSGWSRDQRFDPSILTAVAGKRITVGELLSHLRPINGVPDVAAAMSAALSADFLDAVSAIHDRWLVEIQGEPKAPIIKDRAGVISGLESAFRFRHILAHEAAPRVELSIEEGERQLQSVAAFVNATEELVFQMTEPDAPLTQADMNEQAARKLHSADQELSAVLGRAAETLDRKRLDLLRQSQEEWLRYRDLQSENEGLAFEGGSLRPTIHANAHTDVTRARIKDLERLLIEWGK